MKTLARLAALLALAAAAAARAQSFSYANDTEIVLAADLDGDGREDAVVVDRATGAFRVGYQAVAGTLTWADARAGGLQDVSGVSAGRLLAGTRDALALASPTGNRVNIVAADTASTPALPLAVYTQGFGPESVAAIDVGGAGNTALADLVGFTALNNAPNSYTRFVQRDAAGVFSGIQDLPVAGRWTRLNPIRLKPAAAPVLGMVQSIAGLDSFRVYDTATGTNVVVLANVAADPEFVVGHFAGTLNHVVFYSVARSNLVVRAVAEPSAGVFNLGAAATYPLGTAIRQVFYEPKGAGGSLLVIRRDAATADVYDFDGSNPPVLRASLAPAAGDAFTTAVPLASGEFQLLSGVPGTGRSTKFQHYQVSGGNYVLKSQGALPAVNPLGIPANVFLFANEPFVSGAPGLVRSLNAADWSSALSLGGGQVTVKSETFGTSAQGLRNPVSRTLGTKPAAATAGLANQYRDSISIASFLPAIGDEASDVSIVPPAGPQTRAIQVTVAAANPAHIVVYRTGPSVAWAARFGSATFTLFQDATVEFFASPDGVQLSRIHRAAYTFAGPAVARDSDGDGVPDFVEIAKGLNPNGGNDSDGDGFTDKAELFAGTNPLDPNDPPAGSPIARPEENTGFNLLASPRTIDGAVPAEVSPLPAQNIALYDLQGNVRQRRRGASSAQALFNPVGRFADAPADTSLGLLVLATDPHFAIANGGTNPVLGREVVGLMPIPSLKAPQFTFTPAAGDLLGQADAWIAAAKAAAAGTPSPLYVTRFGPGETTSLALLELKLEQILLSHGHTNLTASNHLSLASFRPQDITRVPLSPDDLLELPRYNPSWPSWDVVNLHGAISNALHSATGDPLRTLAGEVYRISCLSNNVAPGRFPLPLDVLRDFVATGQLHSNYLASVALTPSRIADAKASADAILAAPHPRPTATLSLHVAAGSFQPGLTRLFHPATLAPYNLWTAHGVPFKFPDTFDVPEGSLVQVFAFTDFVEPFGGSNLQVIAAELDSVPAPQLVDADGDLLPDAWECLFLAGNGDPSGDFDGDGFTNLQEYLDRTDPADKAFKGTSVIQLKPPVIKINLNLGGGNKLAWNYPAQYADLFDFLVMETDAFGTPFGASGIVPRRLAGGGFELELPAVQDENRFYILVQQLRAP